MVSGLGKLNDPWGDLVNWAREFSVDFGRSTACSPMRWAGGALQLPESASIFRAMSDPYSVLGVARTASDDDIRKAFRKLAKKHHPDLNPGDKAAEAKFKEISQANDILSDTEKRRRFDAGEIDATGQEMPPRGFYRDQAGGIGRRQVRARRRPRILRRHGRHLLRDVRPARRRRARLRLRRRATAKRLRHGRHAGDLQPAVPFLVAARGGKQRVNLPDGKTLDIDVPEGTTDGTTLRLKGQGMPGAKGRPAGDAYVEIHVEPHAFFEPRDNDIHVELPVTLDRGGAGRPDQRADGGRPGDAERARPAPTPARRCG